MIKRTISGQIDKGDVNHNNRKFIAENVDRTRVKDNITIVKDDIKQVYHELFDDALKDFNARQTRKDRIIHDYREHIRHGRQEKEFYEVIFQVGNKDDTPVGSDAAKTATEILQEFTEGFIKRNPHLRVFNAVIHLDEATPHVHIDFVPFATGQKRGLSTRNTLSKALEQQGFKGEGKLETNTKKWIESEKAALAEVMLTRGIEWEQLGTHNEHLSVLDYKKQERQKELAAIEDKTKSAEYVLHQREQIITDAEAVIKRLDGQYQEKREAVESITSDLAAKQSEIAQVTEELTAKTEELSETASQLAEQQALIAESAGKASQIKDINSIETKKTVFGGKITVAASDYDKVSTLAKKQIAAESNEKKLNAKIKTLEQEKTQLAKEKEELQNKNDEQAKEISLLKSVRERLNVEKLKAEIEDWKKKYNKLMEFIESLNLKEQLEKFLHPVVQVIKHKGR
ncbi:MAG: plasmid recombination protein [Ruminococcus sp.]|nr:plasmid recombination protein [Ruminiclostridium sp.]MBP1537978.1 plasmid recombination protein [Ruminococcus sp.]